MITPIERVRVFWIESGHWLLAGVCAALLVAGGYSWATRDFRGTVLELQTVNITERNKLVKAHEKEKTYLRKQLGIKNEDQRKMQEQLIKLGVSTGAAAESTGAAIQSLSKSKGDN